MFGRKKSIKKVVDGALGDETSVVHLDGSAQSSSAKSMNASSTPKDFALKDSALVGATTVSLESHPGRGRLASKITQSVQFEYFAPYARTVVVSGTFNNWSKDATHLNKYANGKWKLEVELPLGRYEYLYVVDGTWTNDQRPIEGTPNPFGGFNNVVQLR